MSSRLLIAVSSICLLIIGCGRKELPFTDHSKDPELYAKSARAIIESNCKAALKGDPSIHLGPVIQELERNDRPVGNRKAIFVEMRTLCREAVELIRANEGKRPDIRSQLDQIIELASQLPERSEGAAKPPVEPGT